MFLLYVYKWWMVIKTICRFNYVEKVTSFYGLLVAFFCHENRENRYFNPYDGHLGYKTKFEGEDYAGWAWNLILDRIGCFEVKA